MLSPIVSNDPNEEQTLPSLTYVLNFETGEIENIFIDGQRALEQFVIKTILTPRFRHLIYSTDYGSEIEDVLTEDLPFAFLQYEIPRLIEEALLVDDRIQSVENFVVTQDSDGLYVEFDIFTMDGNTFTQGVNI